MQTSLRLLPGFCEERGRVARNPKLGELVRFVRKKARFVDGRMFFKSEDMTCKAARASR